MNRDEEIKEWAHNKIDPEFIDESYLDGLIVGAHWADETMLDRAVKWLTTQFNMPGDFEYHFRGAMTGKYGGEL